MTRTAIKATRPGPTSGKRRAAGSPDLGPYHTAIPAAPDWSLALCRDLDDADMFFPPEPAPSTRGEQASKHRAMITIAKAVCMTPCPLLEECRSWALATNQQYGIFGGLTARERRAIRRRGDAKPTRSRRRVNVDHGIGAR